MSIQSNQSAELTNSSTERPFYAPNTSRQLSRHCIKCSPSNFKIRTFITLLSALSGWCFVCFFKGNMTASELKNHNKPNKKPAQTTPPSKTDSVQFYNTIVSFTEQKNILRLQKNLCCKSYLSQMTLRTQCPVTSLQFQWCCESTQVIHKTQPILCIRLELQLWNLQSSIKLTLLIHSMWLQQTNCRPYVTCVLTSPETFSAIIGIE